MWGLTFCTEQADKKHLACGICYARCKSALKSHEESIHASLFSSGDNKKHNWEMHCLHHHPWAHAAEAMNKGKGGAAKDRASSALVQTTLTGGAVRHDKGRNMRSYNKLLKIFADLVVAKSSVSLNFFNDGALWDVVKALAPKGTFSLADMPKRDAITAELLRRAEQLTSVFASQLRMSLVCTDEIFERIGRFVPLHWLTDGWSTFTLQHLQGKTNFNACLRLLALAPLAHCSTLPCARQFLSFRAPLPPSRWSRHMPSA